MKKYLNLSTLFNFCAKTKFYSKIYHRDTFKYLKIICLNALPRYSMFVNLERDSHHSFAQGEPFSIKNIECVTGGTMSSAKMPLNSMTLILTFF